MAPRLKVFTWSDGFHSHPVAVSSRAKALAAWEVRQDLFGSGLAQEITSGPDFEAAMASPGVVLKRGEAIDAGKIDRSKKTRRPTGPTAAQKAKVRDLEAELETLDVAFEAGAQARAKAREAIDQEEAADREVYERDRLSVRRKLTAARRAIKS
ncbi:hypothetical protein [Brevundimonas sp. GCM10030266]|uniref:hypothetical protein n=1 Tax=Brevundimonas sp. GCM10030266 TaxID=3273386 RepID=UPI003605D2FF